MDDQHLVQLPDSGAADGAAVAHFAVDGVKGCHVIQQVVGILAGARLWDGLGFEALVDESASLGFV